jgi:hypothetical protein
MSIIPEESPETLTFTDVLRIEVAALQAEYPERLGAIARAHAAIIEGHVVPLDDGSGKVLSDDQHTWYVTNGTCSCAAGNFQKPCKHLSAWRLYTRVAEKYAAHCAALWHEAEGESPDVDQDEGSGMVTPPPPTPTHTLEEVAQTHKVPKEYLQMVHGHPFVLYKGLLAMAHAAGLTELHAEFILVEPGIIALAKAQAVFADGRRFAEAADATPDNVGDTVQAHFARIALTRAKARCLRDALNIGLCSLEEIGDVAEVSPTVLPQETRWCAEHQATMTPRMSKRTGAPYWSHDGPDGKFCFGD